MIHRPVKVLHALSILQERDLLQPIPPLAGCAPCWNIFRLHEALETSFLISSKVFSACTKDQLPLLVKGSPKGDYQWISFLEIERKTSSFLTHLHPLSQSVMRKILDTNTWLSYRYLRQLVKCFRQNNFDLFVLDDGPQNLRYLRKFIPRSKLAFFLRGQIGMSRAHLGSVGLIITTNENLRDYSIDQLPEGSEHPVVKIVPNSLGPEFFDLNHFPRRMPNEEGVNFKIVFAGRIVPEKGVRELIEAFKIVYKRYPRSHLSIIGSPIIGNNASTEYYETVKRLASDIGDTAVSILGHIPYSEMASHYLRSHLAVFPSTWVEGFGMVALEAMRCGLPVIVSRRPGFLSFVEDGKNGIVVNDPKNIQELAEKIERLILDPALAQQLAQKGYETSLVYTPENAARMYEEAITSFIASQRNS